MTWNFAHQMETIFFIRKPLRLKNKHCIDLTFGDEWNLSPSYRALTLRSRVRHEGNVNNPHLVFTSFAWKHYYCFFFFFLIDTIIVSKADIRAMLPDTKYKPCLYLCQFSAQNTFNFNFSTSGNFGLISPSWSQINHYLWISFVLSIV